VEILRHVSYFRAREDRIRELTVSELGTNFSILKSQLASERELDLRERGTTRRNSAAIVCTFVPQLTARYQIYCLLK
jgi:hypothetical protein